MRLFLAMVALVGLGVGCDCGGSGSVGGGSAAGGGASSGGGAASGGGSATGGGTSSAGGGTTSSGGGSAGVGGGSAGGGTCGVVVATIRDFNDTHPDMEKGWPDEVTPGLVLPTLDSDNKPVYALDGGTRVTTTPANFHQWYHDVPGTNVAVSYTLPLVSAGGQTTYDSNAFFPIDDAGFGNQGRPHNYHFTTEIHASFTYDGGEVFTFRGDDDVWVFVNRKLALDLGGTHQPREGTIDFDSAAGTLGLTKGQTYPFDVFHAERQTVGSNFRITTSITCFGGGLN